jgi:hypothetical protein
MRPAMYSPIWPLRWPTVRTASMESAHCGATGGTPSGRWPPPPRCGAVLMNASTPLTCRGFGPPARMPAPKRGRPGRPPTTAGGCTWMSMPPSASITPTTKKTRPRPGRKPSGSARCWCFWTAPTSPPGKPWPGCCDPETPGPTPPPTTSACSNTRWPHCRRPTDPTPTTPLPRRC